MTQNITTTEYNVYERNGQLRFSLNTEKIIPEDAPVRLTDAQLEELDYRRLYAAFSSKGRNPVTDPRVLFKVLAYASEIHIYSNRQIVDACENRIDMIWLLDGEPVPDQSTIARFKQRCAAEIEDLFYQYARLLEKQGETDHDVVFIDGTKIESRAGRYTFCWRGTVEKHLAKVRQAVLEKTGYRFPADDIVKCAEHLGKRDFILEVLPDVARELAIDKTAKAETKKKRWWQRVKRA